MWVAPTNCCRHCDGPRTFCVYRQSCEWCSRTTVACTSHYAVAYGAICGIRVREEDVPTWVWWSCWWIGLLRTATCGIWVRLVCGHTWLNSCWAIFDLLEHDVIYFERPIIPVVLISDITWKTKVVFPAIWIGWVCIHCIRPIIIVLEYISIKLEISVAAVSHYWKIAIINHAICWVCIVKKHIPCHID